jgi:hypothetical protein
MTNKKMSVLLHNDWILNYRKPIHWQEVKETNVLLCNDDSIVSSAGKMSLKMTP